MNGGLSANPAGIPPAASRIRHSRESGNPHPRIDTTPLPLPARPPPSFRRSLESTPPVGVRRVTGMGLVVSAGGWRRRAFLPHPTLSRWERAGAWRPYGLVRPLLRRWQPYSVGAHGRAPLPGVTKPSPLPRNLINRTTKSPSLAIGGWGDFVPTLHDGRGLPGFWIPAYAGMTAGVGDFRWSWAKPPPFILRPAQDERLPLCRHPVIPARLIRHSGAGRNPEPR